MKAARALPSVRELADRMPECACQANVWSLVRHFQRPNGFCAPADWSRSQCGVSTRIWTAARRRCARRHENSASPRDARGARTLVRPTALRQIATWRLMLLIASRRMECQRPSMDRALDQRLGWLRFNSLLSDFQRAQHLPHHMTDLILVTSHTLKPLPGRLFRRSVQPWCPLVRVSQVELEIQLPLSCKSLHQTNPTKGVELLEY